MERHRMLRRPTVIQGTPASWEECIFLGIDPLTGDSLEVAA
jgi:hypothetical protein